MIEAIEKICQILRTPEYPQGMGLLVEFDIHGNIISKCALGEISCRSGLPITESMVDDPNYNYSIMRTAHIPIDLYEGCLLPCMLSWDSETQPINLSTHIPPEDDFEGDGDNIQDWIWKLNDNGFTYDEIAEFLEVTFQDY